MRHLILLVLAMSAHAATVTESVTCGNAAQLFTTASSADCQGGAGESQAFWSPTGLFVNTLGVLNGVGSLSATVALSGSYDLTFLGGAGLGLYMPVIGAGVTADPLDTAFAMGTAGNIMFHAPPGGAQGGCQDTIQVCGQTFTFGVPTQIFISLTAFTNTTSTHGSSNAHVNLGFVILPTNGTAITPQNFTLTESAPEPGTWLLVAGGLGLLARKRK